MREPVPTNERLMTVASEKKKAKDEITPQFLKVNAFAAPTQKKVLAHPRKASVEPQKQFRLK